MREADHVAAGFVGHVGQVGQAAVNNAGEFVNVPPHLASRGKSLPVLLIFPLLGCTERSSCLVVCPFPLLHADFAACPFVQRSWKTVQSDPLFVTNLVICVKGTCVGRAVLSRRCPPPLGAAWALGREASPRVTATLPGTSVPWNRQAGSARLLRGSIAPRSLYLTMFAFLPKSRSSGRQSPPSSAGVGYAKLGRRVRSAVDAKDRSLPL